ncbi:membrane-spanning 4-domains subfamily A member 12-like [Bos indicus]|uniref:Membrane-spanning 4-domains subfamily A member 12-like n=1 Tax=Bos indicus TaxID=9915 RepID=A0ABM4QK47_BOSIN|nr:membrane-spanning 4-domains, subfamily A-like [Bos taurus]XP_027417530.1 membrane-spanning 4-domains subfamily A member 4A-like isoform X1 [Bos indicus x Bos taurus]DAA21599.1 TPA: membrane-spanning 4-domains, subfamily A-like [Bos taurus]
MTRRFPLRTEARALGAVQIVLALFHYTLGFLCAVLFLGEEDVKVTGSVPVLLTLGYIIWSSPFFLISGCVAIIAQKKPTRYQLTSAIVMNIFSACFSAFGTIILCIACLSYVAEMEDYVWSQLAGGMLLQYLLFSSVTELIVVSILLCWIVRALKQSEPKKESYTLSESSVSS